MSDEYSYTIDQILSPATPIAAVRIEGGSTTTRVPEDAKEARVDRIFALALVEETYNDSSVDNVIPMVQSDEGILMLVTEMPDYIGFIEAAFPFLPLTVSLDEADDRAASTCEPFPAPTTITLIRSEIAMGTSLIRKQIQELITRHNAKIDEPEPGKLIQLASKTNGQLASDPTPIEPEGA